MKILLSSKDTGGQFSLIEGLMPPDGDGGLHLDANEDESMHLLEGELEVTIGHKKFSLGSGGSYFAPRNVPHRLRNRSQTPVRSLLLTTPGGFDAFIAQAGIRLMELQRREPRADTRVPMLLCIMPKRHGQLKEYSIGVSNGSTATVHQ